MANVYTPPGVNVQENSSPSVSPLLASPADICLVGLAGDLSSSITPITTTDTLILSGTSAHVLPTLLQINNDAQLVSVLSVTDILNPSVGSPAGTGYTVGVDFTVQTGEGPPDGSQGTITRIASGSGGTIPDGALVAVTYTYVPSDYWNPIRLFDIGSVESRFGPSWKTAVNPSTGQLVYMGVNSQLSMSARIAFENGAQSVICQPLFERATPGDPTSAQQAPDISAIGNAVTWQDTLHVLRGIEDLNILVPVIGQDGINVSDSAMLSIFSSVQGHLAFQNSQQQYIIAIFGEDGTTSANEAQSLIQTLRTNHAPTLQANYGNALSSQCVLLNTTVFQRPTPGGLGSSIEVGGQYAAAAVAGALGGRPVSSSLTRKALLGFQGVTDPRTPSDKNLDGGAGLFVIEQVGNSLVRCRHSVTLDILNGPARSELNVVRAKYLMMESIKATLDDQIIGNIIADANSPLVVRSAISSVLSLLQASKTIVSYTTPIAALTNLNPTTITASFSYKPSFTVNFVTVTFSLDLTTSDITAVVNDGTSNAGT